MADAPSPGERRRKDWEREWEISDIVFHRPTVDNSLKKYVHDLTGGKSDASVLVTWCGKSLDVPWLSSQGYNTVGVELTEVAVKSLFQENNIPYLANSVELDFVPYKAVDRNLKVFVGNYYKLTSNVAGIYDCVWDNNALGAAEPRDREAYCKVLLSLLKPGGRVLMAHYEFDDRGRTRHPYSVSRQQMEDLFSETCEVRHLESPDVFLEFFKNAVNVEWAVHNIYMITKK